MAVERLLGGLNHRRMVGEAQVVVGAKIQDAPAVRQFDLGGLRASDDPLGLEQSVGANGGQAVAQSGKGGMGHVVRPKGQGRIIVHCPGRPKDWGMTVPYACVSQFVLILC